VSRKKEKADHVNRKREAPAQAEVVDLRPLRLLVLVQVNMEEEGNAGRILPIHASLVRRIRLLLLVRYPLPVRHFHLARLLPTIPPTTLEESRKIVLPCREKEVLLPPYQSQLIHLARNQAAPLPRNHREKIGVDQGIDNLLQVARAILLLLCRSVNERIRRFPPRVPFRQAVWKAARPLHRNNYHERRRKEKTEFEGTPLCRSANETTLLLPNRILHFRRVCLRVLQAVLHCLQSEHAIVGQGLCERILRRVCREVQQAVLRSPLNLRKMVGRGLFKHTKRKTLLFLNLSAHMMAPHMPLPMTPLLRGRRSRQKATTNLLRRKPVLMVLIRLLHSMIYPMIKSKRAYITNNLLVDVRYSRTISKI